MRDLFAIRADAGGREAAGITFRGLQRGTEKEGRPMRRIGAGVCVLACAAVAVPTASAGGTSVGDVHVSDRAASVRVVVAVTGGTVSAREGSVQAIDPEPGDGRAVIEIAGAAIPGPGTVASGSGVQVRLAASPDGARIVLDSARRTFKFVSYSASGRGDRLIIDLWKGTGARRDQMILSDGCLRITRWNPGRQRASLAGLELRPLFEHGLVISVRDAQGRRLGLQAVTATEGAFAPDFSGYLRPGRWSGTVTYGVAEPRRGLLEAWSASARDGALECLVQVPVLLRPPRAR
jgi:hypothetical protein